MLTEGLCSFVSILHCSKILMLIRKILTIRIFVISIKRFAGSVRR